MIINANSPSVAANYFPSAAARPKKTSVGTDSMNTAAETPDAAPDTAQVTSQNIASTISPLENLGAAQAAIQAARKQFMEQPNVAILAQATNLPNNALRLLQ